MRRLHDGRTALAKAAVRRKADAWRLVRLQDERHTRAAVYLGGYAIECKLKLIAMEVHGVQTLRSLAARIGVDEREVYTHGLAALVELLPAAARFRRSEAWRPFATRVNRWKPAWRYDPTPVKSSAARDFMQAIDRVFAWLSNNC